MRYNCVAIEKKTSLHCIIARNKSSKYMWPLGSQLIFAQPEDFCLHVRKIKWLGRFLNTSDLILNLVQSECAVHTNQSEIKEPWKKSFK